MKSKYKVIIIISCLALVFFFFWLLPFYSSLNNFRNTFSDPVEEIMKKSTVLKENIGEIKSIKNQFFSYPRTNKEGKGVLKYNIKTSKGKYKVTVIFDTEGYDFVIDKYIINGKEIKETMRENFKQTELDGVQAAFKIGTLKDYGATVIIKDKNGDGFYSYSNDVRIEKKENGKWDWLRKDISNKDEIIFYETKDGLLEIDYDWSKTYGGLPSGSSYRIIIETISKDNKKDYITLEF